MKTPVWLLMLLLVGLIFFLFFLNLVLGSVSIPFRAVWDICLWGSVYFRIPWVDLDDFVVIRLVIFW